MDEEYDGGIKRRMMHAIDTQVFRHYGFEELAKMSDAKANDNTHHYTCLAAPPELEQFGLTHMVCRVDMPERPVAAFNSSQAASIQCDDLNGFAKQDRPELDVDVVEEELKAANAAAAEREAKTINMTLSDKVAMAQAAAATK